MCRWQSDRRPSYRDRLKADPVPVKLPRVAIVHAVAEIPDVQSAVAAENMGVLGRLFVVVVDHQERAEVLGGKAERLLNLVDARRSRTEAVGDVKTIEHKARLDR